MMPKLFERNRKTSDLRTTLRARLAAEERERTMRAAARWVPYLREVLRLYGRSEADAKAAYEKITGPRAHRDLGQALIAWRRRVDKETKAVVPPDNLYRLAVQGTDYSQVLHDYGLTTVDLYLAVAYSWVQGADIEDAARQAEDAMEETRRLETELAAWSLDDVTHRVVETVDGKKVPAAFYAIAPDVPAGDVTALIAWARQHPEALP